jgi:hypothetical protein
MRYMGFVIVTVAFGAVAIFARPYAAWIIRSQNRTWGFSFGHSTERWTVPVVRLIGMLGVAMGILALVQSGK